MLTLYGIVADLDNAEIITMLSFVILSVAYLYNMYKNVGLIGRRFSTWEWIQIYALGFLIFLSLSFSFAKLVFPENADKLMSVLGLDGILNFLTVKYQSILLAIIRTMI